jgi:hypothetical protein
MTIPSCCRPSGRATANTIGPESGPSWNRPATKRQLPPDADRDIIHEILYAAILYHLAAHPDTGSAQEIAEPLTAVLRQAGYPEIGKAQNNA